ncbi:MAG TPA: hypothetical protein VEW28_10650 [Candidatus Kapabacteria bacterium]|nr:hypothetical protein [Candidatus Kapabacteria bacterium]
MKPISLSVKQILACAFVLLQSGVTIGLLLRGCEHLSADIPIIPEHSSVSERSVQLRDDSTSVAVSVPAGRFAVRGSSTRRIGVSAYRGIAKKDSFAKDILANDTASKMFCLDSVGYFSGQDSTQMFPDTISLCHNIVTNEFDLRMRTSERKSIVKVKYLARDSVTLIRDSVEIAAIERRPWWEEPVLVVGGVSVGFVLGAVAVLFAKH